ncbi:hypothetical protein CDD83_1849 [Cordyceps sp. RAO-2017]|nr:hypothetical protein CDD83_1849 [Cordyceps sp. RAO-2017]
MILFTSAQKPMLRAGKGTGGSRENRLFANGVSWENSLWRIIADELLLGGGAPQPLAAGTVYASPTIAMLAAAVSALAEGRVLAESSSHDGTERMQELYGLNAADMPLFGRQPCRRPAEGLVVLLTESTGSLGSCTLDSLMRNPRVSQIYYLNRGRGSRERQERAQTARKLGPLTSEVECLDADLSQPCFGLSGQIAGVRRIIDFAAHSAYGARVLFISSVGAVGGLAGDVTEQVYRDWEASISVIICRAGQVAGPLTETGSWPKQEWLPSLVASSKYLGLLPASLGRMNTVDWIPVDVLAQSLAEVVVNPEAASAQAPSAAAVYHAANPRRIS